MTTIGIPVTVGQGTAVHNGIHNPGIGRTFTACGAEGRGVRISRIRSAPEGTAVTCPRCKKSTLR